jgi:hypothetical protein
VADWLVSPGDRNLDYSRNCASPFPDNRAKLNALGAPALLVTFMRRHPDDIFVQWQGTHAVACFAAEQDTADAVGEAGLEVVLECLTNTGDDVSELGFTGVRALSQLTGNSPSLRAVARERGAAAVLQVRALSLTDPFP